MKATHNRLERLEDKYHVESKGNISFRSRGVSIWISAESDLGKSVISRNFAFDSKTRIEFEIDKFEGYDAGMAVLNVVILALLDDTETRNLVLLENGELPLLLLLDGVLIANDCDPVWVTKWKTWFSERNYTLKSLNRV